MTGKSTFKHALANKEHYIALGMDTVWLDDGADDLPWSSVTRVGPGAGYRFAGPCGARFSAVIDGLTFTWCVEFEGRDANGKGVSMFDRPRLRKTIARLPPAARFRFASFLLEEVLPDLSKRTEEVRESLNAQEDSMDCVRGLIRFADGAEP